MRTFIVAAMAGLTVAVPQAVAQPAANRTPAPLAAATQALDAGDTDRALALATAQLVQRPQDVPVQLLLIRIHIDRDEWDQAYALASRAARAHPSNVDVMYYLGLVTRHLAAAELERLARVAPGSARVHQLQAEALEAQDRRADAEQEYTRALAARPDLLEALLGLARLERIRLACDDAIVHYEAAEAIRPTFEGAYGLGVCLSARQDEDGAAARFEQAVRRNPSDALAWAALGRSLVKLNRTADGIEKLQRAIALEPRLFEAYYALGLAYQSAGDAARAQAAFARAEELRGR